MYWWEKFVEQSFKKSLQNNDLDKFRYKDYILYLNNEFCGILVGIHEKELNYFKFKLIGLCAKYNIPINNIYGIFLDINLNLIDQERIIKFILSFFTECVNLGFRSFKYSIEENEELYENIFNKKLINFKKDIKLIYYNKLNELRGNFINYKDNKYKFINKIIIKYHKNDIFDAIDFEISDEFFED
jgi:hypothetical protein